VIFAGAGVSIDPPSNYPSFEDLATRIGGGVHPRLPDEAIDRYLGRLGNIGITVHRQVQSVLSSPDSMPNKLHESVIAVFDGAESLRLVTTNFDLHFTTCAIRHFRENCPEVFSAPALPVGDHFNGIVHLHGAVDKEADRLIVTDADFGRAYITEGWATHFLQRLFSKYVVLFVGYSHQDMLLNYLARGLTVGSGEPKRFVLTPPGDDARWDNLGIIPVHYPLSEPPQSRHCELGTALSAWAEQSHAGALALETRIKSIVEAGIPLEAEDRDFLERSLSDISTLRFFTRYAKASEWLNWLEDQPVFSTLFSVAPTASEIEIELAEWFAQNFTIDRIDETLDLLRRKHLKICPVLWHMIALILFQRKPGGEKVAKWVPILLETKPSAPNKDYLQYLLTDCKDSDNAEPALLLLGHLTRPKITLTRSLWHSEITDEYKHIPDIEVSTIGDEIWLNQAWSSYFSPNLDRFAVHLATIVTSNLTEVHGQLRCFGKSWEPVSFSRGMIESREQDHLNDGMSVLIDIAAGVMGWACWNRRSLADSLIDLWGATEGTLLRRLAIFGMAEAQHIPPDAKLDWLLEKGFLYEFGLKHEVFFLLAKAYPKGTPDARIRLLNRVREGNQLKESNELAAYEKFNAASWLTQKAPDCELAQKLLAQLQSANPSFRAREHPDLHSWISSVFPVGMHSKVNKDDLLSYDLGQLEAALADSQNQTDSLDPRGDALSRSIWESARDSVAWSVRIAAEACDRGRWPKRIWAPLIEAWISCDLMDEQWEVVLDLLIKGTELHESELYNLSMLLRTGIQKSNSPIPVKLLDKARLLAGQILPYCRELKEDVRVVASENWVQQAINHPGGQLTEFYVYALSKLQQAKEADPDTVAQYVGTFRNMVSGDTYSDELSRIILASFLHFLYSVDNRWTIDEFLPLFDPATNTRRAQQCLHGYLSQGRWTESMLAELLRYY
jgi:hypothetical protein